MTLTDEIYRDLMDGLGTRVDYDKLRLKWEGSKGPFYNALQRVFTDVASQLAESSADLNAALQKAGEAQQRLAALEAREKETEARFRDAMAEEESIERQKGNAAKQLQKVNCELAKKKRLLDQACELDEMGFGMRELRQLQGTLAAIGAKRGLKAKDARAVFFSDLKDYDAKVGFEREIQRLNAIAETDRLEAGKWQAEKESLERAYRHKKQVVDAMESLLKQGVKPEDISVWGRSVQAAGGLEELGRDLARYKSVKESVAAWQKEIKRLELSRAELSAEVNALEKRKTETQAAVAALSKAGIDEIRATREEAVSGVRAIIVELTNEGRAYSEQKVEAVRLEKELACARYLFASDETLKSAPISAAEVLQRTVTRHCIAKGVNLRVPVPDSIKREASFYSLYDGIRLLELLRWVATGLATAAGEDRSAAGGPGVQIIPRPYRLTPYT